MGRVLAAVFVAEIGDVSRFPTPGSLCSWAGPTPRHRESDTTSPTGTWTAPPAGRARLLDGAGFHPSRIARNHLRVPARASGIPERRVEEVLHAVELTEAADRKVGGFSLGMRRAIGVGFGPPRRTTEVLVFNEPANGLVLRASGHCASRCDPSPLGDEPSSFPHVLAEVAKTADEVVVVNRRQLVTQTSVEHLTHNAERLSDAGGL